MRELKNKLTKDNTLLKAEKKAIYYPHTVKKGMYPIKILKSSLNLANKNMSCFTFILW